MVPSGPRRWRIKGPGGHLFWYKNITAYFYINMYAGFWQVFLVGVGCAVFGGVSGGCGCWIVCFCGTIFLFWGSRNPDHLRRGYNRIHLRSISRRIPAAPASYQKMLMDSPLRVRGGRVTKFASILGQIWGVYSNTLRPFAGHGKPDGLRGGIRPGDEPYPRCLANGRITNRHGYGNNRYPVTASFVVPRRSHS